MKVTIYTDGAARGNPDGPGGYGAVILYQAPDGTLYKREYSQGYVKTTNNRMELMAAIAALEALIRPCEVDLYSDSSLSGQCLQSALDRKLGEEGLEAGEE